MNQVKGRSIAATFCTFDLALPLTGLNGSAANEQRGLA